MTGHKNQMNLIYVIVIFLLAQKEGIAQFTYISANTAYDRTTFEPSQYKGNHHQLSQGISILVRPFANFGLGLSYSTPLTQSKDLGYSKSPTSAGVFSNFHGRYGANEFLSQVTFSPTTSIYGQFFFETKVNFYIKFGLSYYTLEERFVLHRWPRAAEYWEDGDIIYHGVPGIDIDINNKKRAIASIFGFGIQPHISDRIFVGGFWDFKIFSFGKPDFDYAVSYTNGRFSIHDYVYLDSHISKHKVLSSLGFSIGIFL